MFTYTPKINTLLDKLELLESKNEEVTFQI